MLHDDHGISGVNQSIKLLHQLRYPASSEFVERHAGLVRWGHA
jgi:hypothetical protein